MKIEVSRISQDGLVQEENISASALDLTGDPSVRFEGPIRARAQAYRITNVVSVDLSLEASMSADCSRCLKEVKFRLEKNLKLNYPLEKTQRFVELDEDIRDEIILGYPMKFLCQAQCRGLCPNCGKNLNESSCDCKIT